MDLHNVGRVIAFEVTRSLRKPAFWLLTFSIPLLIAAVIGLAFFSSVSTEDSVDKQSEERFSFTYTDASGVVDKLTAAAFGGREVPDEQRAIDDVRADKSDAHMSFPKDLVAQPTRVYGQDAGLFGSGKYGAVAQALIKASVAKKIGDPQLAQLAASSVTVDSTMFRDGESTAGIMGFLPPLAFLVLFFLSIVMLGNQMLNVTLEEKENRVTEMILTTIRPRSLIVGKVVALVVVGIVQGLVFMLPSVVIGLALPGIVQVPDLSLGEIVIDPWRMAVGAFLFAGGFLMFTGLLTAIGAIMPSVKEASSAYGVILIAILLPLYAIVGLVTEPRGLAAQIFTYFPLTAPVTAMARNAAGALDWWEALLVLVELFAFAGLMLATAERLFRTGSISYDARLNVRKALGLHRAGRPD